MTFLRFLILAIVVVLGTVLLDWWIVPIIGAAYGFVSRATKWPGSVAACAGAVAWAGYLAVASFGGAPIADFGGRLGQSMGLPAVVPYVATLLFPAVLAGLAAHVAANLGPKTDTNRR